MTIGRVIVYSRGRVTLRAVGFVTAEVSPHVAAGFPILIFPGPLSE